MTNKTRIALALYLSSIPAYAADTLPLEPPPVIEETVTSQDGEFRVLLDSERSLVQVTQSESEKTRPSDLRLRILRKGQGPVEVKLKLMDPKDEPFRYTAKASPWNNTSVIGFELEISFDKKSWKKLKKALP